MGLLRNGLRHLASASAAVTRGAAAAPSIAARRSFIAPAGRGFEKMAFTRPAVGALSLQNRGFHVDPENADAWEKFILGLPATLKEDMKYRKKLFYEADKGGEAVLPSRELCGTSLQK
jgi:hypothetical protein